VVPLYSLGNRIWQDNDAGGGVANNGVQDGTEAGIAGVTVRLLTSGGAPASDIDGGVVTDETTDSNWYYRFDRLPAGDYLVEVRATNFGSGAVLEGFFSSWPDDATPNNDQDAGDLGGNRAHGR
jgi:hypothetical protein